jgi:hypothetical protein
VFKTLLIEVDDRSLDVAKIYIYSSTETSIEDLGGVTLLPGKVTYEVDTNSPIEGHVGLQAVGDSFNLDAVSIRFK